MNGAADLANGSRDDCPSGQNLILRAGTLSLLYERGGLRYLRVGENEIVRGIYVAVRDHNWETIPGRITDFRLESGDRHFRITYASEHQKGPVDFRWNAEITGSPDGTVEFTMNGRARSAFRKNRIGFCLLHPMQVAGTPCTVRHGDGRREDGAFPRGISPRQPFLDVASIEYEVGGLRAFQTFEGDVFEMEDQRNWTDASFKTYCTPLGRPFPVEMAEGEEVFQRIVVGWDVKSDPALRVSETRGDRVRLRPAAAAFPLPPIGLCLPETAEAMGEAEERALAALGLGHLRVELRFSKANPAETLRAAAGESGRLGIGLELALHLASDPETELESLIETLRESRTRLARVLVFKEGEKSCSGRWIALARRAFDAFDSALPLGSGTDAFFAELNRERPPLDALDFLCYSINPQVHAFDDASLTETIPAQAETLRSASGFSGGKGVAVSPVTLKMRFNPNATVPEPGPPPGELPRGADPRQKTLFGSGWTAASIASLAAAGASSLTYYQTTGPLGLMPRGAVSVFPLYHAFADFGEFAGGSIRLLESSDALRVSGFVLAKGSRSSAFLINHGPSEIRAQVSGLDGAGTARVLDEGSVLAATGDPENFRSAFDPISTEGELLLAPYSYVRRNAS